MAFHESQIGLDLNLNEEHEKDSRIESLNSGKFSQSKDYKKKILNGIEVQE